MLSLGQKDLFAKFAVNTKYVDLIWLDFAL